MTEGDSGLPFLGSLMSLVSHKDIRYEGVLSKIDIPNSTISLSNGERPLLSSFYWAEIDCLDCR
jgi:hypothetical protein